MKICVLSSGSFEFNYSSYHLMRDLIENLLDNNEVILIQKSVAKKKHLPAELQNKAGIEVLDVPFKPADKANLSKRLLKEITYYIKATRSIWKSRTADVFFLQSNNVPWLPIALIKMLAHKPVVYNVQDIFPQNAIFSGMLSNKSVIGKILLFLQKWALKHSEAVITISEDMKQTLAEAGADENKIAVAYNWANEVREQTSLSRANDNKYHVVYAGNIGRMQNVEMIIQTAALLTAHKDIQFDIYGNGAMKDSCVRLAQKLNADNIDFKEPVPAEQAYALYENADLNIVPLAKGIIKTALPSKTGICLSCGNPVIFCVDEDSKFAELVDRDNVVSPSNPKQLATAILCRKNSHSAERHQMDASLFDRKRSIDIYCAALSASRKL